MNRGHGPLAVALLLTLTLVVAAAPAAVAQGVTLTIAGLKGHPVFEANFAMLEEFKKRNPNIDIKVADIPYAQVLEKMLTSLGAKSPEYDIIWVNDDWTPLFAQGDFLVPVSDVKDFQEDLRDIDPKDVEALTFPHAKYHLTPAKLAQFPVKEPKVWAMPWQTAVIVLFYRKDLVQTPPKTHKEFMDLIEREAKPRKLWGLATGIKAPEFGIAFGPLPILRQFGGDLFDTKWNPTFNQAPGQQMVQLFHDWIWKDKILPPAATTWGRTEARNLFADGKALFLFEDSSVYGLLRDPAKSKVADKVGMAVPPILAPAGKKLYVTGGPWAWGVNKHSRHKEEAFKVIQWLSSKDANIALWKTGSHVPRLSARAELMKMDPEFKIVKEAYDNLGGYIWSPDKMIQIPEWPELSFKIESAFVEVWTNQKPLKKALDEGAEEVRKILERAGYHK